MRYINGSILECQLRRYMAFDTVDHSIVLVWTTKFSSSQLSTIHKLFGDPDFYLLKLASGVGNDLGLSIDTTNAGSLNNRFETFTYDYGRHLLFFTDSAEKSLNYGPFIYNNHTTYYGFNPTKVSDQVYATQLILRCDFQERNYHYVQPVPCTGALDLQQGPLRQLNCRRYALS